METITTPMVGQSVNTVVTSPEVQEYAGQYPTGLLGRISMTGASSGSYQTDNDAVPIPTGGALIAIQCLCAISSTVDMLIVTFGTDVNNAPIIGYNIMPALAIQEQSVVVQVAGVNTKFKTITHFQVYGGEAGDAFRVFFLADLATMVRVDYRNTLNIDPGSTILQVRDKFEYRMSKVIPPDNKLTGVWRVTQHTKATIMAIHNRPNSSFAIQIYKDNRRIPTETIWLAGVGVSVSGPDVAEGKDAVATAPVNGGYMYRLIFS